MDFVVALDAMDRWLFVVALHDIDSFERSRMIAEFLREDKAAKAIEPLRCCCLTEIEFEVLLMLKW